VPGVDVLITAGLQVPVIAGFSFDDPGRTPGESPMQYGPIGSNVGCTFGKISISIVVGRAHSVAKGVKVKVKIPGVVISIVDGDQVPFMPGESLELVGKTGAESYWHKGHIGAKVGKVGALMVMSRVAVVAHIPASGVNV